MNNKILIEYGKEAELIGKVDGGYRVRITNKDEVIEKTIAYKPLPVDGWKYSDGQLVKKNDGLFYRLKRYTTYNKAQGLVYAYKLCGIKRFTDDLVYEHELDDEYEIVESPFLSVEEIEEIQSKKYEEEKPFRTKINEANEIIKESQKAIGEIEKNYNIENKCGHIWEENGEEEYNEGKSTKKFYTCMTCGKEDTHYWHKF